MEGQPIRLWLASPHFYPTYGGAQNRYRGYIPGFLERGLDVQILAGTPELYERTDVDIEAGWYGHSPGRWLPPSALDGVSLERIRLPDVDNVARTRMFYEALLDVCRRPSEGPVVLQILTNLRPEALPWLRKLKREGVVILYSVSQFPNWPNKPMKRIYRRFNYRRVYNEFDALVTNNENIAGFLRGIGVRTRIQYIPNGVNLQRFHPALCDQERKAAAELRRRLGIPPDHRVVATVGAVKPRKGQHKLVEAWRSLLPRHPDTHLLIIGPRFDANNPKFADFGRKLSESVAQSGAAEQVHFTGPVDNVEDWLRAADIFALPSDREGTPNSVLEAMATGLPCVVTPFTGISAGIGVAGEHYRLVKRRSPEIAEALVDLLDSEERRLKLGAAGRRFVQQQADQGASLDSYARLYADLCAGDTTGISVGNYVWRPKKERYQSASCGDQGPLRCD